MGETRGGFALLAAHGRAYTTATRSHRGRKPGTRVDDRDSSLIAPDDTVSSGVKPQNARLPQLPSTPSAPAVAVDEPSREEGKRPRWTGHVSCSSIRKSTPGYLGSGPEYTTHVRGSFFLSTSHVTFTWIRASFIGHLATVWLSALWSHVLHPGYMDERGWVSFRCLRIDGKFRCQCAEFYFIPR